MTRVLYFTPIVPFPAVAGNCSRILSILDGLGRLGCKTTVLVLETAHAKVDLDSVSRVLAPYNVDRVIPYTLWSPDFRVGRFLSSCRGWWTGGADGLSDIAAHSPLLTRWFRRHVASIAPDVIWSNYAAWDRLLDHSGGTATRVIDAHDLVTLLHRYIKEIERRLALGRWQDLAPDDEFLREDFFDRLGFSPHPEEYRVYDQYTHTLAISRTEQQLICAHTQQTQVLFQPMTQDVSNVENTHDGPGVMVMASSVVNTQAFAYFAKRILPAIRLAVPTFRVRLIGKSSALAAGIANIEAVGFVPAIAAEYARARFALVPTFGWTGQQVRIMEAMAHGVPVVALKGSARSSPLEHGVNGLVAEDAQEFAEHALRLWNDPHLCRQLGAAARATIAATCTQQQLVETLSHIVAGSPRPNREQNRFAQLGNPRAS